MASYSYDETGQYYFFLITFLTFILVPWTYYAVFRSGDRNLTKTKPPVEGWTRKHDSVRKSTPRSIGISKSQTVLALGWVAFAFVLQRSYSYESGTIMYDPYQILGISTGMAEGKIRSHYRKLSLKYHPDKLRNADNATLEAANSHYVELTKAYKALTDETVRQNYEQYGHPDGKQDFSMGIALPKWIVETQNNGYVIALYALLFGVGLPWFVGSWWYGSRRVTKDGILTTSAELFFRQLKEEATFDQLVQIVAAGLALDDLGKQTQDICTLDSAVKEATKSVTQDHLSDPIFHSPKCKRASTFLYAHMFRVPISDLLLAREKAITVEKAITSTVSIMNISLAHNWLNTYLIASALHQHLVQAVHPTLSPVLQLPDVSVAQAESLAKAGAASIHDFVKMDSTQRQELLSDMSSKDYEHAVKIAENFPTLQVVDAKFKVVGEKVITPGCFVQLVMKVKITPPSSQPLPSVQVNGEAEELTTVEQGEEKEIDELIGRRKAGAMGETPDVMVHAPYYPKNRKPAWFVFVGDHKLSRVFVPPTRFTSFGFNKVRTLQVTFQAPPGAGLYTFQTYVRSDSYIGTDAQKDMMMQVQEPSAQAEDVEDDISEPEEDTLAGQMASMRGKPVKRIEGDDEGDDDSTSGSEDESESSSSSDSDSD